MEEWSNHSKEPIPLMCFSLLYFLVQFSVLPLSCLQLDENEWFSSNFRFFFYLSLRSSCDAKWNTIFNGIKGGENATATAAGAVISFLLARDES